MYSPGSTVAPTSEESMDSHSFDSPRSEANTMEWVEKTPQRSKQYSLLSRMTNDFSFQSPKQGPKTPFTPQRKASDDTIWQTPQRRQNDPLAMWSSGNFFPAKAAMSPAMTTPVVNRIAGMGFEAPTPQPALPTVLASPSKQRSMPRQISPETLSDIVHGKYKNKFCDYAIIDARFAYEYKGGHIEGSRSFPPLESSAMLLWASEYAEAHSDTDLPAVVIVHCEFSKLRGPKAAKRLTRHFKTLPPQNRPVVYILEAGYCKFVSCHPDLCEPQGGYVEMTHSNFTQEVAEQKSLGVFDTVSRRRRGKRASRRGCVLSDSSDEDSDLDNNCLMPSRGVAGGMLPVPPPVQALTIEENMLSLAPFLNDNCESLTAFASYPLGDEGTGLGVLESISCMQSGGLFPRLPAQD